MNAQSLERKTFSTNTSIESTDSEKAVKGSDDDSPTDGRVRLESSDELYRRGKEAETIINATDPAASRYFGSHFNEEAINDVELWPLAASNREEAEAMVEGLERAHGK